jgi:hypothetical protein
MNVNTSPYRELTREEKETFFQFLRQENLRNIQHYYAEQFWQDYKQSLQQAETMLKPLLYPGDYADGDRVTLTVDCDLEWGLEIEWIFKRRKDNSFEHVTSQEHIPQYGDIVTCLCGNNMNMGFAPSTKEGSELQPLPSPYFVCRDCGRIIEQETRQVLGFRQN